MLSRVENGECFGSFLWREMMVGNNDVDAEAICQFDFVCSADAIIHRNDESDIEPVGFLDKFPIESVAVMEAMGEAYADFSTEIS